MLSLEKRILNHDCYLMPPYPDLSPPTPLLGNKISTNINKKADYDSSKTKIHGSRPEVNVSYDKKSYKNGDFAIDVIRNKYKPLSPEREIELSKIMKQYPKDSPQYRKAHNELILSNIGFAYKIAKEYISKYPRFSLGDFQLQAYLGLEKAAERYDGKRENKFITYAVWWIKQQILEYVKNNGGNIRYPVNYFAALSKIDEAYKKLGPDIPIDVLSQITGLTQEAIENALNFKRTKEMSLASQHSNDDRMLINKVKGGDLSKELDEKDWEEGLATILKDAMEKYLDKKSREVLIDYFYNNMTLGEIGIKSHLTRERIRQIRDRALGRLRKLIEKGVIKVYD